jgi:hypothetical protein
MLASCKRCGVTSDQPAAHWLPTTRKAPLRSSHAPCWPQSWPAGPPSGQRARWGRRTAPRTARRSPAPAKRSVPRRFVQSGHELDKRGGCRRRRRRYLLRCCSRRRAQRHTPRRCGGGAAARRAATAARAIDGRPGPPRLPFRGQRTARRLLVASAWQTAAARTGACARTACFTATGALRSRSAKRSQHPGVLLRDRRAAAAPPLRTHTHPTNEEVKAAIAAACCVEEAKGVECAGARRAPPACAHSPAHVRHGRARAVRRSKLA